MRIRPAGTNEDLTAILQIRTELSAWLRSIGQEQWTADKTTEITSNVTSGLTWIIENQDQILASVTLDGPDFDFWQPSDDPHNALYVYKMMVRRSAAGRDLGGLILNWASDRAARQGLRWLRLDCWRTNHRLKQYYRDHGFELVRIEPVPGRKSGALFQRSATIEPEPRLPDHVALVERT